LRVFFCLYIMGEY